MRSNPVRPRAVAAVTGIAALLLLAGCGGDGGGTTTAGQQSSAAPSPPRDTTQPAESTVPPPPSPGDGGAQDVLGPRGLGALELGMTQAEAMQTGLITLVQADICQGARLKAGEYRGDEVGVQISKTKGVVAISAYSGIETPEGARLGDTLAQVQQAYPEVKNTTGGYVADAPGNDDAYYYFGIQDGKVIQLVLYLEGQDCAG